MTSEMAERQARRGDGAQTPWVVQGPATDETLLGGMLALVAKRTGREIPPAKARSVRQETLADVPEDERNRRVDEFAAAFESVNELAPAGGEPRTAEPPVDITPPPLVEGMGKPDETIGSLPRFWDHTGVMYRTGRTDELAADPCAAAGAMAPLTALLRDVSGGRAVLPVFDPQTCDGRRELWTTCPDGSVGVLVIAARALLDAGIDLATRAGTPADALRPVAGKLATGVNKLVAADDAPATAGELIKAAFGPVLEKMDAPADRRESLTRALAAVVAQIGELPVARTRLFFDEPQRQSRGSGELFTLVVNPDTCKCPDLILAACDGKGLKPGEQTPQSLETARRLWNLWQRLPDTSGATIERARQHPEIGTLAALLLSRHCLHAMSGGDGAEAASGAKAALARVLAVAEFHRQPRLQKHLAEIEALRGKLAERIREVLAEALPTGDLDALAEGLDVLGRGDVDLGTLSEKVDTAVTSGRVEGARLGRLVDAARGLAELSWRLATGPDGLGRARVGLAIASGGVASWAGAYPYNAFQAPVVIDATGDVGRLARGLLEGQLRQAIAGVRLMRWARMELDKPGEAAHALEALASLRYEDLTDDERDLCPPVLVVADDQALGSAGLSQLTWLLSCGLPVKVIVLSDIGSAADTGLRVDAFGSYPAAGRFDIALLALLTRTAFVVQTSLADSDHLVNGVLAAMGHEGPALVVIHAPSPQRHGFATQQLYRQARLAVQARAYPLLTFDPAAEGVFGACMDLDGNPEPAARLVTGPDDRALTPVDWAATEGRFAEHLAPLADDDPAPVPIAEFLELSPSERAGKTPFVIAGEQRLRVGPPLIADADARLKLWRTLQELAGEVTPFTKKTREAAERDVAAAHAAEIERIKQEYEARIAAVKGEFQAEATERVTERLMALAGRRSDAVPNGEPES
jgi:pyruvate-ferredoxin/flavodoxin oxidoreductase